MEYDWYIYLIAFGGALIAGSVNTLAGNGSAITLSILTELIGLPGNLANGTNRVGVVLNGAGSTYGFYRGGKLNLSNTKNLILITVAGAILGLVIALRISNEQFMGIFKFLMLFMFFVILIKPSRWLKESNTSALLPKWIMYILYFLLGVYGGLIQMGMGIFFLVLAVILDGFTIIHANALKVTLVLLYTSIAVIVFHFQGLIEWPIGLLMGAGQFIGGWATAHFASRSPWAGKIAYGLLLIIVIASLLSLFGLV